MKLELARPHKSIISFPPTELNNFAILTGVNGAGKTHLLEAIANKSVVLECLPRKDGEIRLFNWTNFVAKIDDNASPEAMHVNRENTVAEILHNIKSLTQQLMSFFMQRKIAGDPLINDFIWLATTNVTRIKDVILLCEKNHIPINEKEAQSLATSFIQHRVGLESQIKHIMMKYGNLLAKLNDNCAEKQNYPLTYTETDIRRNFPLTWTSSNELHHELANWFSSWHSAWEYNKINRYYNETEHDKGRFFVSEDEFRRLYGDEPWSLTNEVLRLAGFRHQFTRPITKIGSLNQPFQLRLEDPEDGTLIKADELSSGEKILLAITLMLYKSSAGQNLAYLPRLLLLDEIDAPLHPAFTKSLIDILRNQFVERLGVAVLLTTHSPSTVALSPPESIYELVRKPRTIRQVSKSAATQILSSGYISITPNDIIVITESSDDPEYYQPIYEALCMRADIPAEPPLKFIAASTKNNDGEGGGCLQVRNWAPKLHELGLHRFRGLIDNDLTNKEDKIISVLRRYSIENYLFDPLTIAAYLLNRGILLPFEKAVPNIRSVRDFLASDPITRQKLISSLCVWLAEKTETKEIADSSLINCEYMGFVHDIPSWWTNCRGHDLESTLRAPLNNLGNETSRGALLKAGSRSEMIAFQARIYPELISKDFVEIFLKLKKS